MCQILENMRNETILKERTEVAKRMLKDRTITLEKIAEFVGLSVDEVRTLKTEQVL